MSGREKSKDRISMRHNVVSGEPVRKTINQCLHSCFLTFLQNVVENVMKASL